MGTIVDMHTMHWHANTHLLNGRRGDVIQMTPGSQYSVYMETRNTAVGTWVSGAPALLRPPELLLHILLSPYLYSNAFFSSSSHS